MPCKCPQTFTRGDIPQSHRTIVTSTVEILPIWTKIDRLSRSDTLITPNTVRLITNRELTAPV